MIEYNEAIIKFQSKFDGLKYDKEMRINDKAKFNYSSHNQLVKSISKLLAECDLAHQTTHSMQNDVLSVYVTLFHRNGYKKTSVFEYNFPRALFSEGLKNVCTSYPSFNKVEKVSCMKYMHELAKAINLSSKYGLQALLGIAGGEIDEEDPLPKDKVMLDKMCKYVLDNQILDKDKMDALVASSTDDKEACEDLKSLIRKHRSKKPC